MNLRLLATVLALGLSAVSRSRAEDGVPFGADLSPVGDRALSVQSPDVGGDGLFRGGLVFVYQNEPFVIVTPNQVRDRIVVDQAFVHAQASYALKHRLLLSVDVPVTLIESGDEPRDVDATEPRAAERLVVADPSIAARFQVIGPLGDGEKLAVSGKLWAPVGPAESYSGGDGLRGRAALVGGGLRGRFSWSAEAGALFAESQRSGGVVPRRTGSSITLGAAAAYVLDARRTLQLGPELSSRTVFAGGAKLLDARSTGADLLLTARFRPGGGGFVLSAAAGPGVGQSVGTPDYRALLALAWAPERAPPPPDRDDDAVPDAADVCPDLPGAASSDPVMNGCPELPSDRDGDSIPDGYDACPDAAGDPTGDRRTHGCPPLPDTDGDGENDRVDACPREAGVRSKEPAKNGCPPPKAKLVERRIVISEQVHFETGTAIIRPESDALLRDVASVLAAHPETEIVEVRGHTDDTGPADLNRRLSLERASSVVRWLTEHGVAAARLRARGFGPDQPIASNTTEAGRAQNRRVEFIVVKATPVEEGAAP